MNFNTLPIVFFKIINKLNFSCNELFFQIFKQILSKTIENSLFPYRFRITEMMEQNVVMYRDDDKSIMIYYIQFVYKFAP